MDEWMNGMDERKGPQKYNTLLILCTHCVPRLGPSSLLLCSLLSELGTLPSLFFSLSLLLPSSPFSPLFPLHNTLKNKNKNLLPLRNLPFVENEHREERGKRVRRCHARERRHKAHQIGEKGD